jgi:hypothetical protein
MGGYEMIRKVNATVPLLILSLMLGALILTTSCWGDPGFQLIIENKSQYDLTVYVNNYKVGDVKAGEQIEDHFGMDTGRYKIEAKNVQGEMIFSKTFTFDQMQRIDNKRIWKVVIPSP